MIGHEQSGDQIEHGGLAGAVRTDQRVQRTISHDDGRVDDRLDAAERFRKIARFEHHPGIAMIDA